MAGREGEAVTTDPARVGRVDVHDLVVEEVDGGGGRDGGTGMTQFGLPDGVDGEEFDDLDRFVINVVLM